MSDDQFTKLFKYVEQRFDIVEKKLDEKADKADVDRLITTRLYGAAATWCA